MTPIELLISFIVIFVNAMKIILYCAVIAVPLGKLIFDRIFKHKLILKEIVKGRVIVKQFRCREIEEKGVKYWKIFMKKGKIPVAPSEAVELMSNGSKIVTAYISGDGDLQHAFSKIVLQGDKPEEEGEGDQESPKLIYAGPSNVVNDSEKSLNSVEKGYYLRELEMAEKLKKTRFVDIVLPTVSIGAMAIVIVVIFIFYGNIIGPAIDMSAQGVENNKYIRETVEQNRQMVEAVLKTCNAEALKGLNNINPVNIPN